MLCHVKRYSCLCFGKCVAIIHFK